MSEEMQSQLDDPDMQAAPRALLRAALRAREVARQTKTALVIMRDGVLVEEFVGETGESRESERRAFFELADRLAHSPDKAEQQRLKEELARIAFGE